MGGLLLRNHDWNGENKVRRNGVNEKWVATICIYDWLTISKSGRVTRNCCCTDDDVVNSTRMDANSGVPNRSLIFNYRAGCRRQEYDRHRLQLAG